MYYSIVWLIYLFPFINVDSSAWFLPLSGALSVFDIKYNQEVNDNTRIDVIYEKFPVSFETNG